MLRIKAVNLTSSIEFVGLRYGLEAQRRLIEEMSPADQEVISTLLPVQMLPVDLWTRFHQAVVDKLASGRDEILVEMGQHNAERELRGLYKVFLKMGSPEFIIRSSNILMNMYFKSDRGRLKITFDEKSPGRYDVKVNGYDREHHLMELGVMGWIKQAMIISGARNVMISLAQSIREGKGTTVYALSLDK